jgi:hypothetical protein
LIVCAQTFAFLLTSAVLTSREGDAVGAHVDVGSLRRIRLLGDLAHVDRKVVARAVADRVPESNRELAAESEWREGALGDRVVVAHGCLGRAERGAGIAAGRDHRRPVDPRSLDEADH